MNQTLRITLTTLAVVLAVLALLIVGALIGRQWFTPTAGRYGTMMGQGPAWQGSSATGRLGAGMMGRFAPQEAYPYGTGMMGGGMMGSGMMGSPMMGGGMMGAYGANELYGVEPLSIEEATQSVQEYIEALDDGELELGEMMVFDNHAYAQIVEQSTGIGAMEVLVDPVTGAVSPDFGPNMMWNLKYGHMGGFGIMGGFGTPSGSWGMGGMMGSSAEVVSDEMTISEAEAVEIAQRYLDTYLAGAQADEHADPFYGYYTIHIERDGETVGMLSVNGFSRAVWLHSWHGSLIESSGR